MFAIHNILRRIASESNELYWIGKLKNDFGLGVIFVSTMADRYTILRQTHQILSQFPKGLVRDCGVSRLVFQDLGPNKSFFPNHGFFRPSDKSVTLNIDIFVHPDKPDDFFDHRGYFVSRPEQTIFHEFGHAWDDHNGMPSMKSNWLQLSGWSETPKPGLKQVIIKEKGCPEHRGEWFYDPKSEFTRFYGRKNPWDDWADCFSFFISQAQAAVPSEKKKYFQGLLGKYYTENV